MKEIRKQLKRNAVGIQLQRLLRFQHAKAQAQVLEREHLPGQRGRLRGPFCAFAEQHGPRLAAWQEREP